MNIITNQNGSVCENLRHEGYRMQINVYDENVCFEQTERRRSKGESRGQ